MPLLIQRGRELTLRECNLLLRLDGPAGPSMEGWEFDYFKIDHALNFFQVVHPVRLGYKTGIYKFGEHVSYLYHQIKISTYMEIDDANETLWHELVHASQAERLFRTEGLPISQFNRVYNNAMGRRYRDNPFEIEARELAERYKRMALLR